MKSVKNIELYDTHILRFAISRMGRAG